MTIHITYEASEHILTKWLYWKNRDYFENTTTHHLSFNEWEAL